MNIKQFVQNKHYKMLKYLLGGILILTATISLLAAWYAGKSPSDEVISINTISAIKIVNMVLGFLSLLIAIATLSTQKSIPNFVLFCITIFFIILTLTFASIGISNTQWIYKS